MIRAAGHTHTYSEIEFPFGGELQVYGRKDLLLLVPERVKTRYRTDRAEYSSPPAILGVKS